MALKTQNSASEPRKARGPGRPFTGRDDPRRNNGGVPADVRAVKAALQAHGPELVAKLMELVRQGNVIAVKTGLEYVLGKPTQPVELSGKDGGAIRVVDPSRLTPEELDALDRILETAAVVDEVADAASGEGGEGAA